MTNLLRRPYGHKRTTLKAVNEELAKEDKYLHATKGYRTVSPVRTAAEFITSQMRQGYRWPTAKIAKELREVAEGKWSKT